MTKLKPEKSTGNQKTKPSNRKSAKPDIRAWGGDDWSDDWDIGPWMTRRVEGETRKARKRKGQKENTDPRTAPPFNKFLWSSKAICKDIENPEVFAQDSLHDSFRVSVQVKLIKPKGGQTDPKDAPNLCDGESKESQHDTGGTEENTEKVQSSDPSSNKVTVDNTLTKDVGVNTSVPDDRDSCIQSNTEPRETEVTRLKRLIAIARKHRRENLNLPQTIDGTGASGLGSIPSVETDGGEDGGFSLDSLRSHLEETDGFWAVEYLDPDTGFPFCETETGDSGYSDKETNLVKFSYTRGNKTNAKTTIPPENTVTVLFGANCKDVVSNSSNPTTFVTALNNYSKDCHRTIDGLKPTIRPFKSARLRPNKSCRVPPSGSSHNISPDSAISTDSGEQGATQSRSRTDSPDSQNSLKVDRVNIIVPSRSVPNLNSTNFEKNFPSSHPANAILQKLRENGIHAVPSNQKCSKQSSRASSAVFPIGEILPVGESNASGQVLLDRRSEGQTQGRRESSLPENSTITAKDLLMHRGKSESTFMLKRGEKMLGPPPFRPLTNKTPLHRARETSSKRMYGHTFAQETQDLYQKLLSAKHGMVDPRLDAASARKRPDGRNV